MSAEGPIGRSYADSYAGARAHVAPNSRRTFLEEGATATKRWTREETRSRMADAPAFRHPSPDSSLLRDLVDGYEHITRDVVMRPAKVNLIAACYRVHGDRFLPLLTRRFASTGTVTNLLGEIRCLAPEEPPAPDVEVQAPATPAETLQPAEPPYHHDLAAERVPDDPDSMRGHDRGPSNAGTRGFFSDEQLGVRSSSPTARALGR